MRSSLFAAIVAAGFGFVAPAIAANTSNATNTPKTTSQAGCAIASQAQAKPIAEQSAPAPVATIADRVALNSFNLSYTNVNAQIAKTLVDFTAHGAAGYRHAVAVSRQVSVTKAQKITQTAALTGPATVFSPKGEKSVAGVEYVHVPVIVRFHHQNGRNDYASPFQVTLKIVSAGSKSAPTLKVDGYSAAEIGGSAAPAKSPCQQVAKVIKTAKAK